MAYSHFAEMEVCNHGLAGLRFGKSICSAFSYFVTQCQQEEIVLFILFEQLYFFINKPISWNDLSTISLSVSRLE